MSDPGTEASSGRRGEQEADQEEGLGKVRLAAAGGLRGGPGWVNGLWGSGAGAGQGEEAAGQRRNRQGSAAGWEPSKGCSRLPGKNCGSARAEPEGFPCSPEGCRGE